MRTTDFLVRVARDDRSDGDEEVAASRLRASREQMSADRKKKKKYLEKKFKDEMCGLNKLFMTDKS